MNHRVYLESSKKGRQFYAVNWKEWKGRDHSPFQSTTHICTWKNWGRLWTTLAKTASAPTKIQAGNTQICQECYSYVKLLSDHNYIKNFLTAKSLSQLTITSDCIYHNSETMYLAGWCSRNTPDLYMEKPNSNLS